MTSFGVGVPVVSTAIATYSVGVAVLFVIAASHKLLVVGRRSAGDEPLLQLSRFRAEHASILLLCFAGVELMIAAILVLTPRVGLIVAAIVVGFYWHELRGLSAEQSCNCFGRALAGKSARAARRRNLTLISVCVVCAALTSQVGVSVGDHMPTVFGWAALLWSGPAGVSVVPRR